MDLNLVIEQVGRDRGIDRDTLVDTLKAAVKTAAKRVFGEQRNIEAQFDDETGTIDLYLIMTVADIVENPYREMALEDARTVDPNAEVGDELLFQIFYLERDQEKAKEQDRRYGDLLMLESARRTFGRIAAQTARQVIFQRVREAERQMIYDEFKDRKHELITGIVRRFEKGNIIVDLGRTDALLPSREQTNRESYRPGDRIQAYVKEVQASSRDAQVILSRADENLVIKLFEQEVPEVYEGIVKVIAIAREPGVRSKVAVYSTDSDVDPVGACVGIRGSRVQSVVQELRGEKIDIVPYHTDPARFVCSAISPAQVAKVLIDEGLGSMELIVPDDQLSLAIGRGGQNVRLAAKLTGWQLEIISETRLKQIMAEAKKQLMDFEGVTEQMIDTLFALGYNKMKDISLASVQDLAQLPGYNEERAELIIAAAADIVSAEEAGPQPVTEEDIEREALTNIRGIGAKIAPAIHSAGYTKPMHLVFEEDADRLARLSEIPDKKAKQILAAAKKWYDQQDFSDEEREEHEEERLEWLEDFAAVADEDDDATDAELDAAEGDDADEAAADASDDEDEEAAAEEAEDDAPSDETEEADDEASSDETEEADDEASSDEDEGDDADGEDGDDEKE